MSSTKQKILIVDDEPDILELIEYNLKKEGYNVLTANNGLEAIQIAKKNIVQNNIFQDRFSYLSRPVAISRA